MQWSLLYWGHDSHGARRPLSGMPQPKPELITRAGARNCYKTFPCRFLPSFLSFSLAPAQRCHRCRKEAPCSLLRYGGPRGGRGRLNKDAPASLRPQAGLAHSRSWGAASPWDGTNRISSQLAGNYANLDEFITRLEKEIALPVWLDGGWVVQV